MSSDQQPWSKKLPQGYQDILKSIDGFFQQTFQNIQENPLFLMPIPVNVYETKTGIIIEAELPGVEKRQIGLDIFQQSIRIQVTEEERTEIIDDHSGTLERRGSKQVRQRVIQVPFIIREKDVKASYKNGLLRISIPSNRKQITIE
ncbi:Hsp20/alpha crystallin family protein [Halalkalibacter akibai]|uniref:Heat shock protein class I n=1 Tax=Halalkalibacter akibai (strain ATCC 43226 / DSM 21942 / CIP 109018 / JCM 9157 / 1139) TaxID=1236973 RepID=W4QUZ3_HALA3|nr:Hsp20/alpha crystallin family protein [Halalkalibacter akibai]GAE35752.1 heat shock protein class I [Halalkalibacter akibai JCM 9157]